MLFQHHREVMRQRRRRSIFMLTALMALSTLGNIEAATAGIDLGASQVLTVQSTRIPFAGLNGTPVVGGLSVDFLFNNNQFVRLFTASHPQFAALIVLQTNGVGIPGFLRGTGYLLDAHGNAIPGPKVIGNASGSDGTISIGLFPFMRDETGGVTNWLPRPFDFYGIHFDFIFPGLPLNVVIGGQLLLSGNGKPIGIGPGLPVDIITAPPTLEEGPEQEPTNLVNISTRASVQTGDNVLIGGFIITGTQNKRVLLRAIGPSLPIANKLMNPVLELHDKAGALIGINDNWADAINHQDIANTGAAPTNVLESAILSSLAPGHYTAIVRGVGDTMGVALVEGYDLDLGVNSKFTNISTRGLVQTGDNVMIGGFILTGAGSQKVVIRALGPSLPLANRLADPTLDLRDAQGTLLAFSDNWRTTQESEVLALGIPPGNNYESVIVKTLNPGHYTAIVRGNNGTTGLAMIEVYALN